MVMIKRLSLSLFNDLSVQVFYTLRILSSLILQLFFLRKGFEKETVMVVRFEYCRLNELMAMLFFDMYPIIHTYITGGGGGGGGGHSI